MKRVSNDDGSQGVENTPTCTGNDPGKKGRRAHDSGRSRRRGMVAAAWVAGLLSAVVVWIVLAYEVVVLEFAQ